MPEKLPFLGDATCTVLLVNKCEYQYLDFEFNKAIQIAPQEFRD